MGKPKLFISHATSTLPHDSRIVQVLDTLFASLANQWDVFVDRNRVLSGAQWRTDIINWLGQSQGAVILFNDRALNESNWVSAESLILCFRKSIDPTFQLIPVLFDGLELKATCFHRYEPFQLNEIQAIADDHQVPPFEFAVTIAKALDATKARQPKDIQWVKRVSQLLADASEESLEQAAEKMELTSPSIRPYPEHWRRQTARAIAELMHHCRPSDAIKVLNELFCSLARDR